MEGNAGRLGFRDQFATSLIENGKDVCGSLAIISSVHDVALDRCTYFSIDSKCLEVDVVDSVTNLMVARILLNGRALNDTLTISSKK